MNIKERERLACLKNRGNDKMVKWEEDLKGTMATATVYVNRRVSMIKTYVRELKRLKDQLLTASTGEDIDEFNSYVHLMVTGVEPCLRRWNETHRHVQQLGKRSTESKYGLFMPQIVLWILNACCTLFGRLLTTMSFKGSIRNGQSTEEECRQLLLNRARHDIDQSRCELRMYVRGVKEIVHLLRNNGVRVKDMPFSIIAYQ